MESSDSEHEIAHAADATAVGHGLGSDQGLGQDASGKNAKESGSSAYQVFLE